MTTDGDESVGDGSDGSLPDLEKEDDEDSDTDIDLPDLEAGDDEGSDIDMNLSDIDDGDDVSVSDDIDTSPDDGGTTTSSDDETTARGLPKNLAVGSSILGILLVGGAAAALAAGMEHTAIEVGIALGTIALAIGVYGLVYEYRVAGRDRDDNEIESTTKTNPYWGPAVFSLILGLLLYTGGVVALLTGIDGTAVQVGASVGTLTLVIGVYGVFRAHRIDTQRRHEELIGVNDDNHTELLLRIDDLEETLTSPLGPKAEQLLRSLRTQRRLVEELDDSLDGQSETMSELADELSQRNEAIETVFVELFGDDVERDATYSSDSTGQTTPVDAGTGSGSSADAGDTSTSGSDSVDGSGSDGDKMDADSNDSTTDSRMGGDSTSDPESDGESDTGDDTSNEEDDSNGDPRPLSDPDSDT